jgi:Ca2+-binding EF-hand superfamily protein
MTDEMQQNQLDEELIEAFKCFGAADDTDCFGIDELRSTLEKAGEKISEDDLKLLFDETDVDEDGKIGFRDFMLMMMAK